MHNDDEKIEVAEEKIFLIPITLTTYRVLISHKYIYMFIIYLIKRERFMYNFSMIKINKR